MTSAILKINFLNLLNTKPELDLSLFDEMILNGEKFEIKEGFVEKKIPFNDCEKSLGVKVCNYELLKRNKQYNFHAKGLFEVFIGVNIGYCFIDVIGISLEIRFLFLEKNEAQKTFLERNFIPSLKCDLQNYNNCIKIKPNNINTSDRANILLINCPTELVLIWNLKFICIEAIINKINEFDPLESYQICFHNDNYEDFCYRKILPFEGLNFVEIYNKNLEPINNSYNDIINELRSNDNNFIKKNKISAICLKNRKNLKNIIYTKYNCTNDILEREINQENYIDFIFKSVYLAYIYSLITHYDYKETETETIRKIESIHKKLLENKINIISDNSLKIHEKFILILELFFSGILKNENDYKLIYYNLRKNVVNSPLYFAKRFLDEFINQLDEKSNFFYSLLSVDSGFFECNVNGKDKDKNINVSCYGFNMISLEQIKDHLKNLFPNILIISNDLLHEYAITTPTTGSITLDISDFEGIDINSNSTDEYISKHFGFIIVKNLFHEFMGHKKSSFSKNIPNYESVISFKNKEGNLLFLSEEDNKNLYQDVNEIIKNQENILGESNGDSGFFIEYFFGKIEGQYTNQIIDEIEKHCYLGALLEPIFWHKNISKIKEFIKLKYKIYKHFGNLIKINEELNLENQINEMNLRISQEPQKELFEENKKEEDKKLLGLKKSRENEDFNNEAMKKKKRNKFNYNYSEIKVYGKNCKSKRLSRFPGLLEYLSKKYKK